MLVDGGPPDALVLKNLDKILSPRDRYIDIVALSHAELDHFGGLIEVLKRYRVGVFIWNGVPKNTSAAKGLMKMIKDKNISLISLAAGDAILYGISDIKVLWPPENTVASGESLNETALVFGLESKNTRALFTGDMGEKTENKIMADLANGVDILKVGHHGSKFSSSASFWSDKAESRGYRSRKEFLRPSDTRGFESACGRRRANLPHRPGRFDKIRGRG